MAARVDVRDGTLEVFAHDLVQYDASYAHLSVPYGCIRKVEVGPYEAPPGVWRLDAGDSIALADVHHGHFPVDGGWCFVAFDRPEHVLILDLEDFDWALRPYRRLVLEVEDPDGTRASIAGRLAPAGQTAEKAETPIAWMAIAPGLAVVCADGKTVGHVTHGLGDLEADVFEGIALRMGMKTVMARPEVIDRITDRAVYLTIAASEAASLPPVALEDLREAAAGSGLFRHHPGWRKSSRWDDGTRHGP